MKKRIQVALDNDALAIVEGITQQANENFDLGSINYSDVINEMILHSKVDIETLRMKHTSIKRSLRVLAGKKGIDLNTAIKVLTELKTKTAKRGQKFGQKTEELI